MRGFDRIDQGYRDPELIFSDAPVTRTRERGLITLTIAAALAIIVGAGVYLISPADSFRIATNDTPRLFAPDAGRTGGN